MLFLFRVMTFSFFVTVTTIAIAANNEITPFKTFNQHPIVQIYGLPLDSSAIITPAGKFTASLILEIANEYVVDSNSKEQLVFDGEVYRTTVAVRYGVGDRLDAGLNITFVSYGGGILDSFIIDWHNFFGLPQGGRDSATKGAVNYSYRQNGVEKLKMNSSGSGLGDISLVAGIRLHELIDADTVDKAAFRVDLKLPTGASTELRGSGSTDLALSLCGMTNSLTRWGTFGLFGSVGGLAMTHSRVLGSQHNNLVGFATAGAGWGPSSWISFKVQLNGTTAFYRNSSLAELSNPTFMLVTGGALIFPGDYKFDIGVSEDVSVGTAPDVTFHLALSKTFN